MFRFVSFLIQHVALQKKKNYLSRPFFFCFCETKWDHKVQVDHWLLANRILNWPLNVLKYVGDLKTQPYPRSTDQYRHCTCLRCPLHAITAAVTSHDLQVVLSGITRLRKTLLLMTNGSWAKYHRVRALHFNFIRTGCFSFLDHVFDQKI